jgi:hypothetical protein
MRVLAAAAGARGRLCNTGRRARGKEKGAGGRARAGKGAGAGGRARTEGGNQRRRVGGAPDPGTRRVPPQHEVAVESSASTLTKNGVQIRNGVLIFFSSFLNK